MNYVWAQREMEEHREESETIAVPFLDLKEKEERERGFKTGNQEFWEKTEETKKKWVTEEISLQY